MMVGEAKLWCQFLLVVGSLVLLEIPTVRGQEGCVSKLSNIVTMEVLEEASLNSSLTPREYVLCNHTTYSTADEDENGPLAIFRPNVAILCGSDGAVENNCTIVGQGAVAMVAPPTFFGLNGNEDDDDYLETIQFEGITFQGGLVLATPARYLVRNCIFKDIDVVGSLVTIANYRKLQQGDSDSQAPTMAPSTSSAPTMDGVEQTSDVPSMGPSAVTIAPTSINATASPSGSETLSPTPVETMAPTDNTAAPTVADDMNNTLAPTVADDMNNTLVPTVADDINNTLAPTVADDVDNTLAPTVADDMNNTLAPTIEGMSAPSVSPSQDALGDEVRRRFLQAPESTISVLFNGCQFLNINIESENGLGALIEVEGSDDLSVELTIRKSQFEDVVITDSGDTSEAASTALIRNSFGSVNLRSSCFLNNEASTLVGENLEANTVQSNLFAAGNNVTDCEGKAFYRDNIFASSEVEECDTFNGTVCSLQDSDDESDEPAPAATAAPSVATPTFDFSSLPPTISPTEPPSLRPTAVPTTPPLADTSAPTSAPPSLRPTVQPTAGSTTAVPVLPAQESDDGGGGLSTTILIVIIVGGAAALLLCLVLLYFRCCNRSDIEYQSRY